MRADGTHPLVQRRYPYEVLVQGAVAWRVVAKYETREKAELRAEAERQRHPNRHPSRVKVSHRPGGA